MLEIKRPRGVWFAYTVGSTGGVGQSGPKLQSGYGSGLSFTARRSMRPFIYRCPDTGPRQRFTAEQIHDDDDTYETIACLACKR